MKINLGEITIYFAVGMKGEGTFKFGVEFPIASTWVEIDVTKGLIADNNVHVEVNIGDRSSQPDA